MLREAMWKRLSPLLPPQKPRTGRPSLDHRRRFLEAVLWLARTGAPWRDLLPELMNWRTAWPRLQRWTASGVWDRIIDALRAMAPDAGWEAHMLDSTVIRAHTHAAGARKVRGEQAANLGPAQRRGEALGLIGASLVGRVRLRVIDALHVEAAVQRVPVPPASSA